MAIETKGEYIGIKVKGIDGWLWFKVATVSEAGGTFKGTMGWGAGRKTIHSLEVSTFDITGRIYSDNLN